MNAPDFELDATPTPTLDDLLELDDASEAGDIEDESAERIESPFVAEDPTDLSIEFSETPGAIPVAEVAKEEKVPAKEEKAIAEPAPKPANNEPIPDAWAEPMDETDNNLTSTAKGVAGSRVPRRSKAASLPIYIDIETLPDWDRESLFGLEPIPEPKPETDAANCPALADMVAGTLKDFESRLATLNPTAAYLDAVEHYEKTDGKKREGVTKAIKSLRDSRASNPYADRSKLLSTTPEYCRICVLAWAVGSQEPQSLHLGQEATPLGATAPTLVSESDIVRAFWELVRTYTGPIVVFNGLRFDLKVLFVRSIILKVPASRTIDLSPYKDDVIDLMDRRFGRYDKPMGQKKLLGLYGIPSSAKETGIDGSMVADLFEREPDRVAEYCRGDVIDLREIHRAYTGFFCRQ